MHKWERALLLMAIGSGTFFALLLAIDVGMLPANWRGNGVLFHWQVWLLGGIVLASTRDFVSQVRTDATVMSGLSELLKPLWILRPNKTWLPAAWTPAVRTYLRRFAALKAEKQNETT